MYYSVFRLGYWNLVNSEKIHQKTKEVKMKNLSMLIKVLLVGALLGFLSGCGENGKVKSEKKITFNVGDKMELYYKDSIVEFTIPITLLDKDEDSKSIFTGIVPGKDSSEQFIVSGLLDSFFAEEQREIEIKILGLIVDGKRLVTGQELYLQKKGDIYLEDQDMNKVAYAEIRPL